VSPAANPSDDHHDIVVHLGDVLDDRGMTLTQLAERVGVTIANLSILKNGRAKAMRGRRLQRVPAGEQEGDRSGLPVLADQGRTDGRDRDQQVDPCCPCEQRPPPPAMAPSAALTAAVTWR
jgi:putative transcriptional regulator